MAKKTVKKASKKRIKDADSVYISQSAAARIVGVNPASISHLRQRGTRSFFTPEGMVDTSSQDWQSYLKERETFVRRREFKSSGNSNSDKKNDWGFPDFKPTTLQEEKIFVEIVQKKINLQEAILNLIPRSWVEQAFGYVMQSLTNNVVNLGRRIAPMIAAKLQLPGAEKIIEKIINDATEKALIVVRDEVGKQVRSLVSKK